MTTMKTKRVFLFWVSVVLLVGLAACSPPATALPSPSPSPTFTLTPTQTASPTTTPTETPIPTATPVPVLPSAFSAQYLPGKAQGDEAALEGEQYKDSDIILHSLDVTGTIRVRWADNDPLAKAPVYLDDTLLGEYPVAYANETQKYGIEIGSKGAPFSLGQKETALLRVVVRGADGGEKELTITVTRNYYEHITTLLKRVPRGIQEVVLGYDPLTNRVTVVGELPDYLSTREFLWDEIEIHIADETPFSWREHLENPSRLMQAFIDEWSVSIVTPDSRFSVTPINYTQFISAQGLIIKAGRKVDPLALEKARLAIEMMFTHRPEALAILTDLGAEHAIFYEEDGVASLPEYRYLIISAPSFLDASGVAGGHAPDGFSASSDLAAINSPVAYVVIHELAHVVHDHAFTDEEKDLLDEVFTAAMTDSILTKGIYAFKNEHEFWAEATVTWFGEKHIMFGPSIMKSVLPDFYALLEAYWGPPVE